MVHSADCHTSILQWLLSHGLRLLCRLQLQLNSINDCQSPPLSLLPSLSLSSNLWPKTSVSSSTIPWSSEGRQGGAAESLLLQARQEQKEQSFQRDMKDEVLLSALRGWPMLEDQSCQVLTSNEGGHPKWGQIRIGFFWHLEKTHKRLVLYKVLQQGYHTHEKKYWNARDEWTMRGQDLQEW